MKPDQDPNNSFRKIVLALAAIHHTIAINNAALYQQAWRYMQHTVKGLWDVN